LVLPDAFAEFFPGGDDVEDVIDHLKSQAEGAAKLGKLGKGAGMGAGRHGAEAQGGGDEGSGLGAMDFHELFERNAFLFRIQVEDLAGNEAETAGSVGELGDKISPRIAAVGLGAGDGSKGLGEEPVPGQDRHGLPEDLVVGGATTAEVVVIHTGEVVMDEGVGVDTFHGTGGGQGRGFRPSRSPGGGQTEDRPEPFSSGEEAVAHGLMDERRVGVYRNEPIEGLFDHGQAGFPVGLGFHGGLI